MTKSKERIKIILHAPAGLEANTRTDERVGMVYKKRDGREWVHFGDGYKVITRVEGHAELHVHPRAIQAQTLEQLTATVGQDARTVG